MSASKREELVKNALKAFNAGGYHAVGMDRLAKETGVSKTAIYKHFRTKDDLILATLRLRDEQFRNWLVRRVEALAETPGEQLLAVFTAIGEWFEEPGFKGCMFIKASCEYQNRGSSIHQISAEHNRLLLTYLAGLAQQAGYQDPENLARELLVVNAGGIVMAHLLDPKESAKDCYRAAKNLLAAAPRA